MFAGDQRRRIVCVAGRDDASLVALNRTREWQKAWGGVVRAVFLTCPDAPPARTPDKAWFQCWAASKAALVLAMRDIMLCDVGSLSTTLDDALGGLAGLMVFPASSDASTEIARVSLRMMWSKAARLQVPLLIARRSVSPRRILVVTDGTARTLPVLTTAFELGEHSQGSLAYLNASALPVLGPCGERTPHARAQARSGIPALSAHRSRAQLRGYESAARGVAVRMAQVGAREHADILVLGMGRTDTSTLDEIARTAPCSVLAVPCNFEGPVVLTSPGRNAP
jgi:nucleotide-binding universal stress UspA family protein